MKNNLFRKTATKATALVVGSLIVFPGQAFAISSSEKEVSNANRLGNSKIIVAQAADTPIPEEDRAMLAQATEKAASVVRDALAQAETVAESARDSQTKQTTTAIAQSVSDTLTAIGDATAVTKSAAITEGGADIVANSLFKAESTIGDALAVSKSVVQSPGGSALAQTVSQAATAVGNAAAIAEVVAE